MLSLPNGRQGVLPSQYLLQAIDDGIIAGGKFAMSLERIQPASLDLRLGEKAIRIRSSFLPGDDAVERKVKTVQITELDLRDEGALLETNRPYLIELKERLALPPGIRAKANPKSSTGRVDVFTRIITDGSYLFDEVADGYTGPLYLEVVPLSFPIRVREDLSLNQLRLSVGTTTLSDDDLRREHLNHPLLFRNDAPVPPLDLPLDNGLYLGLDLTGSSDGFVGYRARDNAPLLDLTLGGAVYPDLYWEQVRREEYDRLVLEREEFYLLMSQESVSIPPSLAAEMTTFDPASGELRTHYAGFFDPGFGYSTTGDFQGSRAALEVRAHDVAFMIEHGQRVCKLTFERMLEEPHLLYGTSVGSSYQRQDDPLGKQFLSQRPEFGPPKVTPVRSDPRLFDF